MEPAAVPGRARALFAAVVVLALAVVPATGSTPPGTSELGFWLAALFVPVLVRLSVLVVRRSRGVELGLDSVVVLFLAFALPEHALVVWAVGCGLGQLVTAAHPWVRLHDVALSTLAGAAAISVIAAVPGALEPGPRGLVAAAAGAAAYFVVDLLLSVIAIPLLDRGSLRDALLDDTVPLALACTGGVAALGYLGAIVLRNEVWAFPLTLVPVAALVFASQGFARADEDRVRVRGLFGAASGLHNARDHDELARLLTEQGDAALQTGVQLQDRQPAGDQLGAVVSAEPPCWLVAAPRRSSQPFSEADRDALRVLASLAADCLGRLRLLAELERQARRDPLTGLPNRASIHDDIRTEAGNGELPAVLFCDLDSFKEVNDRYGHDAGDALLRVVAARLLGCVRPGDVVARMGGDEFAVLLPETSAAEAQRVADRVVSAVGQPFVLPAGVVSVAISVGIAAPGQHVTAGELLHQADVAMYAAKGAGRGQAVLCTPAMRDARQGRTLLVEQLRGAGARGELVLHYQPIVEVETGLVDGLEALVRWQHPTQGLLPPGAFIPAAEETGLVDEVTDFVLDRLLEDGPRLSAAAGHDLCISINVPAATLVRGGVVDRVPVGGVSDLVLVVEITETTLAEPQAIPVLEDLRRRQVLVAVDDFGAGHSLAALRQLPIDVVKLDREFIVDLLSDPRTGQIVAVVAQMARVLGKAMVVEGVEDAGQLAELQALGVVLVQGYHVGMPLPYDATLALLERQGIRA